MSDKNNQRGFSTCQLKLEKSYRETGGVAGRKERVDREVLMGPIVGAINPCGPFTETWWESRMGEGLIEKCFQEFFHIIRHLKQK